MMKNTY